MNEFTCTCNCVCNYNNIPYITNSWHQNQILIFAKKTDSILTQIFKFKFSMQGPSYKGHNPWHTLYVPFSIKPEFDEMNKPPEYLSNYRFSFAFEGVHMKRHIKSFSYESNMISITSVFFLEQGPIL